MSSWPVTLLSLLIGVAGWYYLFYSRAAQKLGPVESASANRRRVFLRRFNGAAMILLATLVYIGTRAIDPWEHKLGFAAVWLGVFALLLLIVLLGFFDVRLTARLRAEQRRESKF